MRSLSWALWGGDKNAATIVLLNRHSSSHPSSRCQGQSCLFPLHNLFMTLFFPLCCTCSPLLLLGFILCSVSHEERRRMKPAGGGREEERDKTAGWEFDV